MDNISLARTIRAFIFDVDGVLTDGGIIYDNERNEYKRFYAKDGLILKEMRRLGFIVGGITGRDSPVVARRLNELGLDFHYHGAGNKRLEYEEIKKNFSLKDEEIAYIGDDLNDLPILSRCGLAATPADAPSYLKRRVHFACTRNGGHGCVREFADFILEAQGKLAALLQHYENK